MPRRPHRVFLLSPARASGVRAGYLLRPDGRSPLAYRLRTEGAPVGELFEFASGLYFRGKLAYARAFARPPRGTEGVLVMAPGRGLLPAHAPLSLAELQAIAEVPVDAAEPRFRDPLDRDARALAEALGPRAEVVLLGSIASPKYVEPLLAALGERLHFPLEFVGRGDMSRGGLLLRCVRAGEELAYGKVLGAVRNGKRPPKLPRLPRQAAGGG